MPRVYRGSVSPLARAVTGGSERAAYVTGMSNLLRIVLSGMALGRIAIGAAPFVAAGASSRMLGFPKTHDTATARLMARMFGVRDIGLGVLVFWALRHPEALPFVMLLNAAMDAGDLASILVPLVKRQGIDRAALASAAFAVTGGLGWLLVWLVA
jgi:Domain of unknown function (DUF4267)